MKKAEEIIVEKFVIIPCLSCSFNAVSATLATIGNFLVLLAIWRTPALHWPSNILLSGLAVSDLAVGLIVQPLWISKKVAQIQRNCPLLLKLKAKWHPFYDFLTTATFFTVCAICCDRYLAVRLHLRYNEFVTIHRLQIVLGVVWVVSSIFATWKYLHPTSADVVEITFGIILILTTMWCNIKVLQTVRYHRHRIQVQCRKSWFSRETPIFARHRNSARTMKYIVGLFLVCYLPYFLFLIIVRVIAIEQTIALVFIEEFLTTLQCFNSTLNPMLYCWRITAIRQAVKDVLKKLFKWIFQTRVKYSDSFAA